MEIVRRAAEVLGYACLNVRHLIDPEVIVLGGGVIKACSDYMLPVVEETIGSDQLPGAREGGEVRLSALGDDAVCRRGWPAACLPQSVQNVLLSSCCNRAPWPTTKVDHRRPQDLLPRRASAGRRQRQKRKDPSGTPGRVPSLPGIRRSVPVGRDHLSVPARGGLTEAPAILQQRSIDG